MSTTLPETHHLWCNPTLCMPGLHRNDGVRVRTAPSNPAVEVCTEDDPATGPDTGPYVAMHVLLPNNAEPVFIGLDGNSARVIGTALLFCAGVADSTEVRT